MPRYFFNTRIGNELIVDPEGEDLRNPDRAWEVARQMILEVLRSEGTQPALLEAVIEVTGSRSEIIFEALPTDDPQVRQPDISLARELLGWEPEVELREGLRRTIEQAGAEALIGAAV